MTFRVRLTLVAAAAVALAVLVAAPVVYVVVRDELRSQVDQGLENRAEEISRVPLRAIQRGGGSFLAPGPGLGGAEGYVQVVQDDGTVFRPPDANVEIPVDDQALAVAAGTEERFFADKRVADTHIRVLTSPLNQGFAVQVTRPLTEVDDALGTIRNVLILIALGGIAAAAALGLAVSRAALAPVRRLTDTTETITETRDLSQRIEAEGSDELGRLASSFNTMLAALEDAARAQRRLVADASHELRTPLTSIRTNIEVLARADELPADERERLLADLVEQLAEMSGLVAELVALDDEATTEPEDVRLDLVAGEAVERAGRRRSGVTFKANLQESVVRGVPTSIERAISNLLDNAGKWSPPAGEVEVTVQDGEVVVRDHGPGIDDGDLPYVFDRFYRAPSARGQPGSGLGLAIVRQVAEAHGGEVSAERAEGGGTRVRLRLPPAGDGRGEP
jgi:two-component system, OmpR family, sensor histidine kinase MprB